MTNLNRNKLYDDTQEFAAQPDELKKDFVLETGTAKGADLLLTYEKERLYLWAVYSLNFVDRYDGIRTYNPVWDRRHNVNLVASYSFGKFSSWKATARWNFGSGFPFTPTQGFFEQVPFNDGIDQDLGSTNGNLGVIYGDLNSKRLPDYHRLDLGLTKTWKLDEHQVVQLDFSATNVYDRRNIFYYDRVTAQRGTSCPCCRAWASRTRSSRALPPESLRYLQPANCQLPLPTASRLRRDLRPANCPCQLPPDFAGTCGLPTANCPCLLPTAPANCL